MAEKAVCGKCAAPVSKDEIAITKRLINRGSTKYYCTACLAEAFGITAEDIERSIRRYRQIGCTLFA